MSRLFVASRTLGFIGGVAYALWELVVEDVQLAVGSVVALGSTLVLGFSAGPALRPYAGWALLVLLTALVMTNLYTAGVRAGSKRKQGPEQTA